MGTLYYYGHQHRKKGAIRLKPKWQIYEIKLVFNINFSLKVVKRWHFLDIFNFNHSCMCQRNLLWMTPGPVKLFKTTNFVRTEQLKNLFLPICVTFWCKSNYAIACIMSPLKIHQLVVKKNSKLSSRFHWNTSDCVAKWKQNPLGFSKSL